MAPLTYIAEPLALLLTWQSADEAASDRLRRVVGRIERLAEGGAVFRYDAETEDFAQAKAAGFQGFPAFKLGRESYTEGVLDALLRRLPPRSREDFSRYLAQHRLPDPFGHSDFALLAYTGARLPGDGFAIVPLFSTESSQPVDFIVEVAGLRHQFAGDVAQVHEGDAVSFQCDRENVVDLDAVEITWNGRRLGYVNRAMRHMFCEWIRTRTVSGFVDRINGRPTRPLLYVRVGVR